MTLAYFDPGYVYVIGSLFNKRKKSSSRLVAILLIDQSLCYFYKQYAIFYLIYVAVR